MKQKVRFVLISRGLNKSQRESAEKSLELIEELSGEEVRGRSTIEPLSPPTGTWIAPYIAVATPSRRVHAQRSHGPGATGIVTTPFGSVDGRRLALGNARGLLPPG